MAARRGSTLIELMIGLMLLTILAGLATPKLSSMVGRFYTRSAAEDVMYAADLAHSRARANRRAYGLQVGTLGVDGELLQLWVRRGADTSCASANSTDGELVYQADYGTDNSRGNPTVAVLRRAPKELDNSAIFLCFKPDGRVVRSDTGLPFSPPGAGYLAGEVYFELARVTGTTAVGDRLQVQIGYNGTVRLLFGRDLDKLEGS